MPINVQGMWPYWKEPASRRTETVHNDLVDMHSMYLLTGKPPPPTSTCLWLHVHLRPPLCVALPSRGGSG